jgi:DNA-binding HxlR family transcriptional regulator
MPPTIAYRLTPMGSTLVEATTPLVVWAVDHLSSIDAARDSYDEKAQKVRELID